MTASALRVLAIADSDSYIKWAAATLERMPATWSSELCVVETPAVPSPRQVAAALAGTTFEHSGVETLSLRKIAARITESRPDVVLFSVRGPVVRVLIRAILGDRAIRDRFPRGGDNRGPRPVFVSGLPGISIPATRKALYYRAQVDALILHSTREIREFRALAVAMGVEQRFALSTLPFLTRTPNPAGGRDIVFAAQAKVPRERSDREFLLRSLAALADQDPTRRVVLKLRGLAGEPQTHAERYPYDELLTEMPDIAGRLIVDTGPMAHALDTAGALVTVSSTAAIEAVHRDIPVLVLDDFGVSNALINTVFEGSGLIGSIASLATTGARAAEPGWLDDNYFHAESAGDTVAVIEHLVLEQRTGTLTLRPQFRGTLGGALRRVWDRKRALGHYDRSWTGALALAVGMPARTVVLGVRAVKRALRGGEAPRTVSPSERQTARL